MNSPEETNENPYPAIRQADIKNPPHVYALQPAANFHFGLSASSTGKQTIYFNNFLPQYPILFYQFTFTLNIV